MIATDFVDAEELPRTVSTPSGIARHFRVQWRESSHGWRLHASFQRLEEAEQCLARLRQQGLQARVVCYNRCPCPH